MYGQYSNILQEYLDSDCLEKIPDGDTTANCYYIPHHAVVKPEKVRIVYNASAKLNNGLTLNDTLLTGPKLQKDIVSILLNFRLPNIVFTCDIKGMFTQIKVASKHQDFQRTVWRFSPNEPLQKYRLKRVTFGLSCSPYLANRTIRQLARDESSKFPRGSSVLLNSIYVDDIVTGHDDYSQAKIMRDELINILKCAGCELRKWRSNSPQLLADLPEAYIQSKSFNLDVESQIP